MTGDILIMELTQEQGSPRETQVQPPLGVWQQYFGIPVSSTAAWRRVLRFKNRRAAGATEVRPISSHDHNWTIELRGAKPPRPAILVLKRTGKSSFDYWVYRPRDVEFDHCVWILSIARNPYRRKGRLWIVI